MGASQEEYREGDPIHDEEFKAVYEHVDGSVNEKVLNMLHHFKPVQSGALPQWAGVVIFMFILGCSLLTYMFASGCFSVRVSGRCCLALPVSLSASPSLTTVSIVLSLLPVPLHSLVPVPSLDNFHAPFDMKTWSLVRRGRER